MIKVKSWYCNFITSAISFFFTFFFFSILKIPALQSPDLLALPLASPSSWVGAPAFSSEVRLPRCWPVGNAALFGDTLSPGSLRVANSALWPPNERTVLNVAKMSQSQLQSKVWSSGATWGLDFKLRPPEPAAAQIWVVTRALHVQGLGWPGGWSKWVVWSDLLDMKLLFSMRTFWGASRRRVIRSEPLSAFKYFGVSRTGSKPATAFIRG